MNFLMNNWYIILAALAVVIFIVVWLIRWFNLPTATQVANLKEWLKWAVTEAEKELGGKTGQLKLRMVYDWTLEKFPWISFISFSTFAAWVDEALLWLSGQLETANSAANNYLSK